ncbi:MAG: hypothetical protein PHD13_06390 [Methanocellales archaeon]|nr:hypothetical protein [Methanocellales archaeon]MDD3291903.1 hypothetical protein [Methanocellales archaeon]MDD5235786.1 hypothetical protein [Methanocellales archaeon]MDD5485543.1 hypothetical protein [Methanocellales archaeon]
MKIEIPEEEERPPALKYGLSTPEGRKWVEQFLQKKHPDLFGGAMISANGRVIMVTNGLKGIRLGKNFVEISDKIS